MPDLEIGRGQSGLPVVGMHNIGCEADVVTKLERCTGKEAKSPCIIPIILHLRIVVDALALEILIGFYEEKSYSGKRRSEDRTPFFGVTHPDPKRSQERFDRPALGIDRRVFRQDDDDVVTTGAEIFGQVADDVGEAT